MLLPLLNLGKLVCVSDGFVKGAVSRNLLNSYGGNSRQIE